MSKPKTGDAAVASAFLDQAKDLAAQAVDLPAEQMDMLDPVTPEDMLEAREMLGSSASNGDVLRQARLKRRGRPPGARNKRTDDFARYLMSFGQHPAITMMQIQATPPEVLVENSRRLRRRKRTDKGIEIDVMQTMTYEAAQSLRIRCATELLPYLESKRPVAVDMTFTNMSDLVIEGVTHSRAEMSDLLDGDYLEVDDDASDEDEE